MKIRVQGRKVDAAAGRTDIDITELRRSGVFDSFDIAWRKTHDQLGAELNHDSLCPSVVMRGFRSLPRCLTTASNHMNMDRSMVIRMDRNSQPLKSEHGRR